MPPKKRSAPRPRHPTRAEHSPDAAPARRPRTRPITRDIVNEDLPDAQAVDAIIAESERIIREKPPADVSNSFLQYLHDIQRYPLLKPDQEYRLAVLARDGNRKAQEALVNHNLRFVITVARKHVTSGLGLEDLVQEGNLGLLKAVTKFNPERGVRFVSYAVFWISQAIRAGLAGQQRAMRLPINRATQLAKIRRVMALYQRREQRQPTLQEISAETAIPLSMVRTLVRVNQAELSLDATRAGEEDPISTLSERIGAESDLEVLIERRCRNEKLADALSKLRPRDAQVLRLFFGLEGRDFTLEEIGRLLGITRERVRQLRDRALQDLRSKGYADVLREYSTDHYPEA